MFGCTLTFQSKLIGGVSAAAALLLFVAGLSYWRLARNREDREWVVHTYQVMGQLDGILQGMTDAETGERGYILTGDDSYLAPYLRGLSEVRETSAAVRKLTADNPHQQSSLNAVEPLIAERLRELQEPIRVRRNAGLAAGAAAMREGPGKEYMDRVRATISAMKSEEERLLTLRSAELAASSLKTRTVLVLGELLAILSLGIAGFIIHAEMQHRRQAEDQVRKLNADLERRVAERTAELAERAKDLERSNMELQQFAYVASHDLQEPLRTIASFTQLLAKRYSDKLDDKAREFINFAVDGSKRMQTLINDLLTYSRVGTQGNPFAATRCDAMLDRILKNLKISIESSGAVITRDPLPVVIGDEGQLAQLFQNLLTNAMKFRGAGVPRIHISASAEGARWKFMVRDNGIGISPEHQ